MDTKHTLYTVSLCKHDDSLYGKTHGSKDGEMTVCGKELNHNYYIINNTFDGVITCSKCLKMI